jgi:hypothetical protein
LTRLLFITLLSITFNSYAQQTDTVLLTADTVSVLQQPELRQNQLLPYLAPAACVFYGALAQDSRVLKNIDRDLSVDLREDYPGFHTRLDDQLQYLPAVSVYALGFIGVKGKSNLIDKSAIYFISNVVMSLTVRIVKNETHRLRPDGSDNLSFPSGHTATAFVAAELMNQEYRDVSPWYSIAGYTMATATGTLRMLNNKHWLSDVVMGAGIGMLSTKLVYAVYPIVKRTIMPRQGSKLMVLPAYNKGSYGLSMTVQLY